jgi:hypothetical protein
MLKHWQYMRFGLCAVWTGTVSLASALLLHIVDIQEIWALLPAFFTAFISHRLVQPASMDALVQHLNADTEALEYSTQLLCREPENLPEHWQQEKTARVLTEVPVMFKPIRWGWAITSLSLSVLFYLIFSSPLWQRLNEKSLAGANKIHTASVVQLPAAIAEWQLTLTPPPYTGLRTSVLQTGSAEAPEGSLLHWQLRFNNEVERVVLLWGVKDTVPFTAEAGRF